ncbi:MAG TPA: carboxynorspermidine decarboxylase [Deltaproteobacteria bacterium]|nr:carboxynorspermidine decarboxylase [Deltaproteobacteria bacterium]
MDRSYPLGLDLDRVSSPCFVVDQGALRRNLEILQLVQERTGCRILLALKGFAMFSVFPLLRKTLRGVCASSPHEARLGREEFQGEVHTFAAAYSRRDMETLLRFSDVIVFNSFSQWRRFKPVIEAAERPLACGIRVNPEHSEGKVRLYDPCAPGSRLGVLRRHFEGDDLDGITGLHFHTLCEHNADALVRTLAAFERKFGEFLPAMKWVNFGGGHHITRADYDVDLLCRCILDFKARYPLQVYLEPGEAVALNAGFLVASVLDVVQNDLPIAILDISVPTHMPDVLEMPYRPDIVGAALPGEKPYTCRLGGVSCLAGDVVGEYSFDAPLQVGQKIVFLDMAHYSMVKTTTFNGVQLPSIALYDSDTDQFDVIREFGYEDYKGRLS